ncbi:MAG: T9SS C-terminal target domain-containing protein [Calditrichaeota bacterium]|nr:MAG: T9SS C-terminal target domain-containing protein [Calditrichota bacterium]
MNRFNQVLIAWLCTLVIAGAGMAQSIQNFDTAVDFAPGVPGQWFSFSADAHYVTHEGAFSGGALVLEKEGTGWGCGAQYTLTAPQDWTAKQVSFWVHIDTVEFTSINFQVFDAVDDEQWEQKVSQMPQQGAWVEFVATISPEYFHDIGNGGVGDGALDVSQIVKFNIIIFNNGENFRRKVMFDEFTLRDVPKTETLIESYEGAVTFEPPSDSPTPGNWNYFSADTVYVADGLGYDGDKALVVEKAGAGWGCGTQYSLPEAQNWLGKSVSLWIYADTVEFSGYNFQVFDAVDNEQWEQKIVTNPLQQGWQQIVAHIDPVNFHDVGNGGVGDGQLDVTQIVKFNIIFLNRGENFTRVFRIDDIRVLDSPIRPLTSAHDIEFFDGTVNFEPSSASPTPGNWNYFSADTAYISADGALSGQSLVIEKGGVGWGCGAQYGLPEVQNWRDKQVSFWVNIDTTEFTVFNFQVFDALDNEQWEQRVSQSAQQGAWVEFVATISPEYFHDVGNGGVGNGSLDVTQISKFNLIILNNGENFARTIRFDNIRLQDQPADAHVVENFENNVTFEPPSASPTPGSWNYFSADTAFVAGDYGHDGASSLVVEKAGAGWGCGVQYALPVPANWTDKTISCWIYVDTVEFSGYNFQVFDAVDGEQWEQKIVTNPLRQGWQQIVAHIDPVYFHDIGNGGVGDGQLDVSQINKFNIIFFNRGENFTRIFRVDDIRVIDSGVPTAVADYATEPPSEFALSQNYPNPFNPSTTIEYSLQKNSRVKITVFDILGRHVRTLVDGMQTTGTHTLQWNGRNDMGALVSSGSYFYVLESGAVTLQRKLLFLR